MRHNLAQRGRFQVRVQGKLQTGQVTNTLTASTSKLETAFGRLIDVIGQWSNSHGAVPPGTKVSIVDTHDGGIVAVMEYLGFDNNSLDEALDALRRNGLTHS